MAEARVPGAGRSRGVAALVGVLVALPALGYVAACGYLYVNQRALLFRPPAVSRAELDRRAAEVGAQVVELHAEDGTPLYAWYRAAGGKRAVLFFHGSGETVLRMDLQEHLVALGWDVLVPSYRGYPGSGGAPSEEGLAMDARAAWRYLTEERGLPPARIVVHGLSLGGGVATELAAQVHPAALVLESTFLSVTEAAAERYRWFPVRLLVRDRFDSGALAPRIPEPVLVVHGDGDEVIPVHQARQLAALFPDARYVEVVSHRHGPTLTVEMPEARQAYDALLAAVAR